MNISNYEKLVLSATFLDEGVLPLLVAEVSEEAFNFGPGKSKAHRFIYRALIKCYQNAEVVDVPTVCKNLGTDLQFIGEDYIKEIASYIYTSGVDSTKGLPQWAKVIDNAGRLLSLRKELNDTTRTLEDIELALNNIDDVDGFFSDLLEKIGKANTVKSEYKPIVEAAGTLKRQLEAEANGEAVSWLPIGWEATKKYKLLPRSALVTVTGLSSIGKSQFLAQLLLGAAIQLKRYDLPGIVVLNTYEMKGDVYLSRMASCLSGVDLQSAGVKNTQSLEYKRLVNAIDFISTLPILFDDGDMTSTQIVAQNQVLHDEYGGVHAVGIDYSELVPDKDNGQEEQRIARIFRNAQSLSRRLDCAVIILSQVSSTVFQNPYKIAGPWATRYSRAGWHATELMVEVYNPVQMRKQSIDYTLPDWLPSNDRAYGLVHKNKNGPTGWFAMDWEPEIVRFSDPALSGFGGKNLYEGLDEIWDSTVEKPLDF